MPSVPRRVSYDLKTSIQLLPRSPAHALGWHARLELKAHFSPQLCPLFPLILGPHRENIPGCDR